jgi:predicted nicotinamide N-methyase
MEIYSEQPAVELVNMEDDQQQEDDYDAAMVLFQRGDFLRKLREMERQDEAERLLGADSAKSSMYNDASTLQYQHFLDTQEFYDDFKHVNYKHIDFGLIHSNSSSSNNISKTPLIIEQDRSLGKGGFVWDAGFILGEHVIRETVWQSGNSTSIVELGSGTGVTGLMVAKAFPDIQVDVTDLPQLMPLLRRNSEDIPNAHAKVLEWGGSVSGNYDVILGSDVVASIYDDYGLAKTIYELAHSKTFVFLACRDRLAGSIENFEGHLKKMFVNVERRKADSSNKNPSVWVLTAYGKVECSSQ